MKLFEFIRLIILAMPLGIFLTFGLLVFVVLIIKHMKLEIVFKRILSFYCLSAAVSSFLLLAYYYRPAFFARLDILYGASVIFNIVLFHHMLCFTIRFGKPFNPLHYIVVTFVCAAMLLCKLLFPEFWAEESIRALLIIAILFGVVHSLLILIRVHDYQLKLTVVLNTTETIDQTKAIPFIVEILLFPWVFAVCPLISGQDPGVLISLVLMASILLALRMNIPLTYAMIRHYATPFNETSLLAIDTLEKSATATILQDITSAPKKERRSKTKHIHSLQEEPTVINVAAKLKPQVLTGLETEKEDEGSHKRIYRKYTRKHLHGGQLVEIDKKGFDSYFHKYKPYLNPDLTIYDLTEPLQSNRTYISKFVNRIYGMNFSSYINLCRLHELERLLALPENKGKNPAGLIRQAGFASHRNYLRTKKLFDKNNKNIIIERQ